MRNGRAKHFGVGLLYSQLSLSACVEAARKSNAIYTFNGATGTVRWLKGEYAYLAPNGAASLLRRLGIKFNWVTDEDLKESKNLERYHTLVVPHAVSLPPQAFKAIESWVHQGGYLLATGQTDLPAELLGLSELKWYRPNGYTMIRYDESDLIAGYRGYTVGICKPASGSQVLASIYEVMNPQKEVNGQMSPLLGPGIIKTKQVVFISLPLFETFGAMLQGHVNFEDMRGWGHRYKYLDWLGRFVKEILEDSDWKHLWHVRVKPWGKSRGVVVLRHDVDS